MKRIARRTLAAIVGLTLGWYVAGYAPSFMPGLSVSMAQEHGEHPAPAATPAGEPAQEVTHAEHGGHSEAGRDAAKELVPHQPQTQIAWYGPVLLAAAGLFIAAVVLGIPALKIRGPLPPDPADSHDEHTHDSHDAGHDDHATAKSPGHH